jgi:hypothetical protein
MAVGTRGAGPDEVDDAFERRRVSVFSERDPILIPIVQCGLGDAAIDLLQDAIPRLPPSQWVRAWCGTAPDGTTRLCYFVESWWRRLPLSRIYVVTVWDGIPSSERSTGEDWVRLLLTRDGRIDQDAFIRDVAALQSACAKLIAG